MRRKFCQSHALSDVAWVLNSCELQDDPCSQHLACTSIGYQIDDLKPILSNAVSLTYKPDSHSNGRMICVAERG